MNQTGTLIIILEESSFADNMDVDEYIDLDHEHSNDTIEEAITPVQITDNPKIIVKKSDRTLELWDGDNLSASYPIGLGVKSSPLGTLHLEEKL